MDTNGFLGNRLSDTELGHIDLVLLDIKMWTRRGIVILRGRTTPPGSYSRAGWPSEKTDLGAVRGPVPGLSDDAVEHLMIIKKRCTPVSSAPNS